MLVSVDSCQFQCDVVCFPQHALQALCDGTWTSSAWFKQWAPTNISNTHSSTYQGKVLWFLCNIWLWTIVALALPWTIIPFCLGISRILNAMCVSTSFCRNVHARFTVTVTTINNGGWRFRKSRDATMPQRPEWKVVLADGKPRIGVPVLVKLNPF